VGAMSYAFMLALRERERTGVMYTYQSLLRQLRKTLHDRYNQKPQLSSSHRIVRVFSSSLSSSCFLAR
jgi:metacaspase-1